jgi:DNA-binding CsgD family transcriptional regulator
MGYFLEAAEAAERVAAKDSLSDRMVALCIEVYARLAMSDVAGAYRALNEARAACREGFTHTDDVFVYDASVVCARLLEDAVCMPLTTRNFEYDSLHDIPRGMQAFCGYQMAYRTLCDGQYEQAIGMARGFLAIAGKNYPLSCIKLWLTIAAACLRLMRPDEASAAFMNAWNMANPLGIVGPFVEMSSWLPGLMRHCLYEDDRKSFQSIRSMITAYRSTWHQLRKRLQHPVPGESLSALEYSTSTLAAWQWTNREIASFLGIAESTVKHYLSSAYQKMGVNSRAGLLKLAQGDEWSALAAG